MILTTKISSKPAKRFLKKPMKPSKLVNFLSVLLAFDDKCSVRDCSNLSFYHKFAGVVAVKSKKMKMSGETADIEVKQLSTPANSNCTTSLADSNRMSRKSQLREENVAVKKMKLEADRFVWLYRPTAILLTVISSFLPYGCVVFLANIFPTYFKNF